MTNQRMAPGRVNGTYVFLAALAAVLLGLFAPGWYGAGLMFVIAAALLVVLGANWRAQKPGTILVRLVIIAVFVVLAIGKVS